MPDKLVGRVGFIGINDYAPQHLAKPGYLRYADNWYCDDGILTRRAGTRKWNQNSINTGTVHGLAVMYRGSLPPVIVAAIGGRLYYGSDATGTMTQLYQLNGPIADVSFASFKDQLFACDGNNRLLRWTGTAGAFEDVGTTTTPRGKYLLALDNRLFQANVDENNNQVVWPDVGSYESWSESTNFANIDPFGTVGPGTLNGIKASGGYPVCYKSVGLVRLFATGNGYVTRTVSQGKGCVAPKSLADSGTVNYYLGKDAIYTFGGGSPVDLTSKKIKRLFDEIDPKHAGNAVGVYHNFKYYLFYTPRDGSYTGNSRCLVWNEEVGEFTGHFTYPFNVTCAFSRTDPNDNGELIVGADDGNIYRLDIGHDDDGVAIIADAHTLSDDFGSSGIDKRFYRAYLHHEKTGLNSVTLRHYAGTDEIGNAGAVPLDGNGSTWQGQTWGNTVWAGDRDDKARYDFVNGMQNRTWGTNLTLRLQQSNLAEAARIHGYEVLFQERGLS